MEQIANSPSVREAPLHRLQLLGHSSLILVEGWGIRTHCISRRSANDSGWGECNDKFSQEASPSIGKFCSTTSVKSDQAVLTCIETLGAAGDCERPRTLPLVGLAPYNKINLTVLDPFPQLPYHQYAKGCCSRRCR